MTKETLQRLVFIIIVLPIFLFLIWFSYFNYIVLKIFILIINLLIFNELFNLFKENRILKFISFLFLFFIYLPLFIKDYFNVIKIDFLNLSAYKFQFYIIIFSFYFLIVVVFNIFKKEIKQGLFNTLYLIFSILYSSISPLLIFLLYKNYSFNAFYIFIFFLSIVWCSNSFAYIVGMGVKNRHPLKLPVSPNKSSEGFLGALVFGTIIPFIIYKVFIFKRLKLFNNNDILVLLTIFFINFLTIIGDLFESMIKRFFGVKDSSNLFKGHGGLLDIVDSILFAFPFYYLILFYF
ncbi:MAG: phosphatidate cytidylyltransferase [Spirochaetes bacterium]|nr:phosphatidate cytidylyltransferase [Spirochaetota bacterium]